MKLEIGIVIYRIFESSISIVPYDIAYGIVFMASFLRHRPYGIVLTALSLWNRYLLYGIEQAGIIVNRRNQNRRPSHKRRPAMKNAHSTVSGRAASSAAVISALQYTPDRHHRHALHVTFLRDIL